MKAKKTNYQAGHEAEAIAADHLKTQGYKILDLNWRTRVCEIDIVAKKNKTIHFVEVKYRSTSQQGSGLEYITQAKLKQMQFAAQCWVQEHAYHGPYDLGCIELSADYAVTAFVESID